MIASSLAQAVRVFGRATAVDVVCRRVTISGARRPAQRAGETIALALGALRCHALDVREDFAREVIVRALAADTARFPRRPLPMLAQRFVSRSLESMARLEAATFVEPRGIDLPWRTRLDRRGAMGTSDGRSCRFAQPRPIELNGMTMTPAEILESLETITGQPALDVLHAGVSGSCPHLPTASSNSAVADGR